MPRRKPKHSIQKGQVLNPNGRPVGSVNEINTRIKHVFSLLLESKLPELEEWLTRAAQRDPLKAADLLLRISERFTPSLSRTEITGADGQSFTPITINIPTINVPNSLREGASTIPIEPSESKPIGELPQIDVATSIGEATSSTDVNGEDTPDIPIPWTIPAFTLPDSALQAQEEWNKKESGGGAFAQSMTLPKDSL